MVPRAWALKMEYTFRAKPNRESREEKSFRTRTCSRVLLFLPLSTEVEEKKLFLANTFKSFGSECCNERRFGNLNSDVDFDGEDSTFLDSLKARSNPKRHHRTNIDMLCLMMYIACMMVVLHKEGAEEIVLQGELLSSHNRFIFDKSFAQLMIRY